MDTERFQKGEERLSQLRDHSPIGSALDAVSPELNRYIKEFAFGDIHSREALSMQEHELVILAGLCTLGYAKEEIRSHINMALNIGIGRDKILEVFIQLAVYAGFPAAVNATFVAKEEFEKRDHQ